MQVASVVLMLFLPLGGFALVMPITCDPHAQNCTSVLQASIDKGEDFAVGGQWVIGPIFLRRSSQSITFLSGSVIKAQEGLFHASYDCLVTVDAVNNVTVIGYGSSWSMRKADYVNSSYSVSEHRHGLNILESTNIRVLGLHISETGGDGIYIYATDNLELRDLTTDQAYRNGLSVISARNLSVIGCRFLRTSGTAPEAGIDIEPNKAKHASTIEYLSNISFVDVECKWNAGSGIAFALGNLGINGTNEVPSIYVENMVIQGCANSSESSCTRKPPELTDENMSRDGESARDAGAMDFNIGLFFGGKKEQAALGMPRGSLVLTNVSVSGTVQPGLEVETKLPTDYSVALHRCSFANVGTAPTVRWGGQNVPLLLHAASAGAGIGGFVFDECKVEDTMKRPFLKCDSCPKKGMAVDIAGTMHVNNLHGCKLDLGEGAENVSLQVACNTPPVPVPSTAALGMVVPLYVDPGPVWKRLADSALAHPGVEITAIISPHHGNNSVDMAGDDIPKYLAHNKTW
jgi:hypothetical protein